MKKIWKDINGYNGLYKMTETGDIYSTYYKKIMKPQKDKKINKKI